MNLVAKEFVAAQDPDDPGVLVLSNFAGAAAQMSQAVLVNPYSPEEIADALALALTMPLAERQERWRALMDTVLKEDVMWWLGRFMAALDPAEATEPRREPFDRGCGRRPCKDCSKIYLDSRSQGFASRRAILHGTIQAGS
jgi:trehalose-6-phosphate synthase